MRRSDTDDRTDKLKRDQNPETKYHPSPIWILAMEEPRQLPEFNTTR